MKETVLELSLIRLIWNRKRIHEVRRVHSWLWISTVLWEFWAQLMASDLAKSKCFVLTQIMGSQPPGGLAPDIFRKKHQGQKLLLKEGFLESEPTWTQGQPWVWRSSQDGPHSSSWISAMMGCQEKGREKWPSWFMCKRANMEVQQSWPPCHMGLPGVRQPVCA